MAFVNETIPEDKRNFGIRSVWTIDHERNAFLIVSGGVPEATFYDLHWKGRIVRINAKSNSTLVEKIFEKDENGRDTAYGIHDVDFNVFSIEIPNILKQDKDAILDMTRKAFEVFGFSGDSKRSRNININNLDDSVVKYVEQTSAEIKRSRIQSR